MDMPQSPEVLDRAAFSRVWQRVMPQDRPDCPFTLDPPPADCPAPSVEQAPAHHPLPAPEPSALAARPTPTPPTGPLCLGPSSSGDLAALDPLAAQVVRELALYRSLARRASAALPLARKKADHLRRLSAARYLISGQPAPQARPAGSRVSGKLLPLLRERYHAEESLVLALFTAAHSAADPCLQELYHQLALETQEIADALRRWLEQAIS